MVNVCIIGAGSLCKYIIEIIETSIDYKVIGIYDDYKSTNDNIFGYPILGKVIQLSLGYSNIVIGIGEPKNRKDFFLYYKNKGFSFPNIIHNSAQISGRCILGEGNIIGPSSIIQSESILGNGICLMANVVINQNVIIKDYALIGSGAIIGNNAEIGIGAHIGLGAKIQMNEIINNWDYINQQNI